MIYYGWDGLQNRIIKMFIVTADIAVIMQAKAKE